MEVFEAVWADGEKEENATTLGDDNWLVVSTHSKNISQNGNLPQVGMKIQNVWNHHLDNVDGKNPANQLKCIVYPHYLQGFLKHPRWLLMGFLNHQEYGSHDMLNVNFMTGQLPAGRYISMRH